MFAYINYPSWISPTIFKNLPMRWYAVMYLVAFGVAYWVFTKVIKEGRLGDLSDEKTFDIFMAVIFGLVIGARVFSCIVYQDTVYYLTHPWMIFWPLENGKFVGLPGMSYHGGVIGGFLGGYIFARKNGFKFLDVSDAVLTAVPLGYTFGRIGNFINGELWGRCTGSSYGMIFPDAPSFSTMKTWVKDAADAAGISYKLGDYVNLPRYPSQLYEALFEGVILFLIIYFIVRPFVAKKKIGRGFVTGFYLFGYGFFRFIIEYFREPDPNLGFIIKLGKESEPTALFKSVLNISMGQILCFFMIVSGIVLMVVATKLQPTVFKKKGHKK